LTLRQPLQLELGGWLPEIEIVYETYGQLSPDRDNAVLVCHALSGDSHVARHDPHDDPGWWDIAVGAGKAIDTDRYCVICPNVLGGCRGTTGPNSMAPGTGRPYGTSFPTITIGDMVEVQRRLIDHLQIDRLLAVVGGSMGGHMVLTWAVRFPERLAGAIGLATSPRLTSQAVAFDVVGRNAILRDPAYQDGQYYTNGSRPAVGLAIARMLGHITYLSGEAMTQKFDRCRLSARNVGSQFETRFAVGSYLAHQGDRFVDRFDANSYLTLTTALDLFDLGARPQDLAATLRRSQCRWLLASFSSDWLFPPFQSREIVDTLLGAGKRVSYCNVQSDCGHDAFLLPDNLAVYGELMRAFMDELEGGGRPTWNIGPAPASSDRRDFRPTSIFRPRRLDYDSIVGLIPPAASVLDLGCGTGGLLARLRQRGHERLMGMEIDEHAILTCVRRGLDVIHGDLNQGLSAFAENQVDVVVLSQTLQAVVEVEKLIGEMLRVGRQVIVSFPNIAYRDLRTELAVEGRAPRIPGAGEFRWYDTPSLRFLSLSDFEQFCAERGVRVARRIALNTASGLEVHEDPNANADLAIFVISRK
jgi:homoserine O-acetyltransferase